MDTSNLENTLCLLLKIIIINKNINNMEDFEILGVYDNSLTTSYGSTILYFSLFIDPKDMMN